ncbi:TatD family hydrolase [[Clostridium] hylemonae]|uniref:TatD family hydrolase n=1 Tax=[Clostridium] hylemonae TaxID=89153 RepID=UPI001FCA5300|nr:TatD family hydrolase [[Clostridium] hylemonae]BDF03020.1 hydrolase TatD [[Clostridium] hylemonae]
MIFDTHAHYDDDQFDEDREELLGSMQAGGVGTIVNISASPRSCRAVVDLARKYPFMYAAVGIHPDHVGDLNEDFFKEIETLLADRKVVAVGEIGLDYYWDNESHDLQKLWFIRQLELARRHDLPVVIHSRDAAADTLEIMKEHAQGLKGIIHCFSYSRELAREYVKMGFSIGVGGVVTFKNAKKLREVVEDTPLTSIVLETDCPYLAPEPNRGKRNNSLYIRYVAEEIARIKNVDYDTVVKQTESNASELYGISDNFVV